MNLKPIVESLEGWCSPDKAQVLFDLVLKSDSQISLELGVFAGRSLIPLGLAHQQKKSGFVLGVDAWSKQASIEGGGASNTGDGTTAKANDEWWSKVNYPQVHSKCVASIDKYSLAQYCGLVRMKSLSVGLLIREDSIDILHQDSNHSQEISCAEVEMYHSKVKQGGYWISDDTNWETVKPSLELLMDKGFRMIGDYESYAVFQKD